MTDTGNFYYRLFPTGDKHYADYQLVRTVPPDTSRLFHAGAVCCRSITIM